MNQLIESIEADQLKKDLPEFKVGDTISVHYRIIEGEKERIQVFTGTVIARKGKGVSETVSIYRVAYGSAMERVLLIHSPRVSKIEVIKRGKVRKSKLYYLRGIFGKKAKVKELIVKASKTKEAKAPKAEEAQAPVKEEAKEVSAEAAAPAKEEKPKAAPKAKKAPAKKKKADAPKDESASEEGAKDKE